jgi:antitoxin MazE
VKVQLIRIGNSQGIRIPKPIITQCGFKGAVDMEIQDNVLILSASRAPRSGWEEELTGIAERGDDRLLFADDDAWGDAE